MCSNIPGHYSNYIFPGQNQFGNQTGYLGVQKNNSYYSGTKGAYPNPLLVTPAIFGAAATLFLGFGFYGHSLTSGYSKYIFFLNIYAIIASIGAGAYIFELLHLKDLDARLKDIIFPLISVIVFFTLAFNLTYSLYPFSLSGTIGHSPITQCLSFLALSIGSISVGETFNIQPETTGTQMLAAIESFWNLFVLSLLISLIS